MEPTRDPSIGIEERRPGYVRYQHRDGRRWEVHGTCICCGECEVGSTDPHVVWTGVEVGRPGAALDMRSDARPDNPILPGAELNWPHCTLTSTWAG